MPDYKNGKIYKIYSPSKNLVYYGSTTQSLSNRMSKHIWGYKNNSNNTCSCKVLECEDYKIELIENYPCNNRHQLERKESEYIQNNDCVNKLITGKTEEEIKDNVKERKRIYYQINKESEKEKAREYREKNRDEQKDYYAKNRNRIRDQQKEYYENNRDERNQYQREYRARLKLKKSDVIVNGELNVD